MHPINLLNNIKIKENQNVENQLNKTSIYSKRTILFIFIALITGLGLIAAIILLSIEFNQIYRLTHEASAFSLRTSSSIHTAALSTTRQTTATIDKYASDSTSVSITTPLRLRTTTKPTMPINSMTTSITTKNETARKE